ncbi:MAG: rhamnulokinase family protein [Anaerolineae bacterium]|nr:rhamnulokinase family protein [Anaerolineae bacterium]
MKSIHSLAVDLGAESGRVISAAFDGNKLILSEIHRFPNRPVRVRGHLHWNVLSLWDEVQSGLRKAASQLEPIASVGVDTWGVDFALLDAAGELIGNPYHYRDARTDGMMALAFSRLPRERIFERTGLQFMQLNTLYQLLAMAEARAPALEHARALVMMPDLFHYWLSGEIACEFTEATTTQFYNPRTQDWARDVLRALGIPDHFLVRIVPPGTDFGELAEPVVRATDARLAGVRVIAPASHDTASAVFGVPARSARYAYISSGTWSLLGAVVTEAVITPQALAFNFTNEGGVNGTFRLLKNIMGMWLVQECRRRWAAPDGTLIPYAELFAMAEAAPAFVALIDPDAPEFLHPEDMPSAIAEHCRRSGQTPPADRGTMVRCILESLALKYRLTLEQLQYLLGYPVEVIHVVGGGAQNALLCQFTADACQVPVVAGPVEATAVGNALVQLIALGHLSSAEEARELVRRSFQLTTYLPRASEVWEGVYHRFRQLVSAPSSAAQG